MNPGPSHVSPVTSTDPGRNTAPAPRPRRLLLVDNEMLRYDTVRRACKQLLDDRELVIDWVWRHSDLTALLDRGIGWDLAMCDFDLGRGWPDTEQASTHSGLGVMGLIREHSPLTDFVAITTPFSDPVNQLYLAAASSWFGAECLDLNEASDAVISETVRTSEAPVAWNAPVAAAADVLEDLLAAPTARPAEFTDFEWFDALLRSHGEPKAIKEYLGLTGDTYRKWTEQLNRILPLMDEFEDCFGGLERDREPVPIDASLMWHNNNGKPALVFVRDRQRFFADPDAAAQWAAFRGRQ